MPSTPHRLGRSCLFALLTLLWAVSPGMSEAANAQSVLNFPRLSSDEDELTGITLFNPNNRPASVEFTAYGVDGAPLSGPGFRNPVRITILAEGQYSAVIPGLFGAGLAPSTVGWFQGTSFLDGIDGFFLALNSDTTFLDGAELPEAATQILFSEVRVSPEFRTELNLVNPNPGAAEVSLRLWAGALSVEKNLTLAGMGVARLNPADFFEVEILTPSALVSVMADQPVAGFQLVRGNGDAFGLNARPAADRTNLNFPQFAALAPFSTELQVTNTSSEPTEVTISAHRPDGGLHGGDAASQNPVTRSLAAHETLNADLAELFGFAGDGPVEGWLRIDSSAPGVEGALVYSLPELGSLAAVADAGQARKRLIFAYLATAQDFFTGVAIVNTSTVVANLRLAALSPDGATLGATSLVLGPGQRVSRLITELIPESAGQSGGLVWIESDVAVRATSLFGSQTSGVLANVPPQSIVEDYLPENLPERTRTTPELTAVRPGGGRAFAWSGAGQLPLWRVNGVAGGNAEFGTVSGLGQYQAPAEAPGAPVTVTAERARQTAGATVDWLPDPAAVVELGVLESVAYSRAERRLFAAELVTPVGGSTQESGTQILDVTQGSRRLVAFLADQEIPAMVVHRRADRDRLLLANRTLGTVIRLDPDTLEMRTLATDFTEPVALLLDPVTGDLLVADETGLIRIPAARVTVGLPGAPPSVGPSRTTLVGGVSPGGIAVDLCSGNIFFSDPDQGALVEYQRSSRTTRVAVAELNQPEALVGLHRKGLPCPDSFHLLALEGGQERIRLAIPSRQTSAEWLELPGLSGVLPAGARESAELESILLIAFPRGLNGSILELTPPPVYLLQPEENP